MRELGIIDIRCEVSIMSLYLALPRKGHLSQVFHIFAYPKKHHNSALVFDPSYPDVNIDTFPKHDLTKFYGDVKEAMPPYMPEPLGKEVVMRCFFRCQSCWREVNTSLSFWFHYFLADGTHILLFKASEYSWDLFFWLRVYGYETCVWIYSWPSI